MQTQVQLNYFCTGFKHRRMACNQVTPLTFLRLIRHYANQSRLSIVLLEDLYFL